MRSKLVGLLIGLLTVAFVALGAVGGSLYWNRVVQRGQEIARAELPAVAAEQIPKVFGYDYQTVERSLTEIYPLLAPDFRQKFEQDATAKVIPEARKRQLVVQISIVGVGVMTAERESGSVLVYMNRTVTDQSRQPLYDGSRLRVDYRKIGGNWLINAISPI
ncbi:mammalian cell entry protein [Mycolicibacterium peregrinum]|jgi:Mce-associated membrane protein|uniref:Mammalian cell entry protein n=2 Tax=Mycolicibacterium TaxID=1866885 RepID=A0A0J8UEQ4_9MYCO|nr:MULTISPECIES: mammalian cell entry protein [Mycolicibacterium]KLI06452.1 mammalian cell entry protein [Mycolicibacterium senegalense]KLO53476.1 mammalian cell entry protein [Mycolicibacterium senegalense]KMV19761.1 mammalian cell entry protein [Mycolicibacterium conceptionense]MCV7201265.1 mammalian cell entry protein [Mycolicibacterium peregrinum]OBJ94877.1 mammalian cell entry protein [Mycolicibacterium conceptionense]